MTLLLLVALFASAPAQASDWLCHSGGPRTPFDAPTEPYVWSVMWTRVYADRITVGMIGEGAISWAFMGDDPVQDTAEETGTDYTIASDAFRQALLDNDTERVLYIQYQSPYLDHPSVGGVVAYPGLAEAIAACWEPS